MPSDVTFSGVYLPPMLVSATVAFIITWACAFVLNKYRLSRFFAYPPAVFLSLLVIVTVLIGQLFVPF